MMAMTENKFQMVSVHLGCFGQVFLVPSLGMWNRKAFPVGCWHLISALRLKRREDSCDTGNCSRSEKQRYDSRGWSDALEHRCGVPVTRYSRSFGAKSAGNCRKSSCNFRVRCSCASFGVESVGVSS